jgi:hypothetical protein
MAVISEKLDFSSLRGLSLTKIFQVSENLNGVVLPYDTTGKTIYLRVYDRATPPVLQYQLNSASLGVGYVSYNFSNVQTDLNSPLDYLIVEDANPQPEILLKYGAITFVPLTNYLPFIDMVRNETPGGVVIPDSYISIKSLEWRLYLQKAFEPNIADADISNEVAWPTLINFLLAKLVVYDYLVKSIKSLLARTSATDQANGASVKKIETGPSNAEFFDSFNSLADFLRPDKNGNTSLSTLAQDICQLAKRVDIFLPMCNNADDQAAMPMKAERYPIEDAVTILTSNSFL